MNHEELHKIEQEAFARKRRAEDAARSDKEKSDLAAQDALARALQDADSEFDNTVLPARKAFNTAREAEVAAAIKASNEAAGVKEDDLPKENAKPDAPPGKAKKVKR